MLTGTKTAEFIYNLLAGHRFSLSCEKTLQAEIGKILTAAGVGYESEVSLSDPVYSPPSKDCIDFMAGGVGMEVKIKGAAMAIFRQCERYCRYPEVKELILITNKSMGFPHEIFGKRTYLLSLGKRWL